MGDYKPLEQRDVLVEQLIEYAEVSDKIIALLIRRQTINTSLIYNGVLVDICDAKRSASVPPPTTSTPL